MRRALLFITALGMLSAACNGISSRQGDQSDTAVVDDHQARNSLDWAGTYEGVLPCADCEGIKTTISLKEDLSYTFREEYINKGVVNEHTGNFEWNREGNSVSLKREDGFMKFFVGENLLIFLDQQGKEITGPLAKNYILNKSV